MLAALTVLLGGCAPHTPAADEPSAAGQLADVHSCSGLVTRIGELTATDAADTETLALDLDTRIRELDCDPAVVATVLDGQQQAHDELPEEALLSLLRNGAVTLEAHAAANGGYPTKEEVLASDLPGVMHGASWDYVTTGPGYACLSVDGLDTVYATTDGLRPGRCPTAD
jgi:hypothetical protein